MKKLFFILIFYLIAIDQARILKHHKKKNRKNHKHGHNRKLHKTHGGHDRKTWGIDVSKFPDIVTTSWTADEQRWDQKMRFQEEYRKQMNDAYNHYNVEKQLDTANHDNLEEINRIYTNLRNNISKAKDFLLDKMDGIYNNSVLPGRWFY